MPAILPGASSVNPTHPLTESVSKSLKIMASYWIELTPAGGHRLGGAEPSAVVAFVGRAGR